MQCLERLGILSRCKFLSSSIENFCSLVGRFRSKIAEMTFDYGSEKWIRNLEVLLCIVYSNCVRNLWIAFVIALDDGECVF